MSSSSITLSPVLPAGRLSTQAQYKAAGFLGFRFGARGSWEDDTWDEIRLTDSSAETQAVSSKAVRNRPRRGATSPTSKANRGGGAFVVLGGGRAREHTSHVLACPSVDPRCGRQRRVGRAQLGRLSQTMSTTRGAPTPPGFSSRVGKAFSGCTMQVRVGASTRTQVRD